MLSRGKSDEYQTRSWRGRPERWVIRVADGQRLGQLRRVELEGGQIVAHRLVPVHLAFVHLHAQRGDGEGLGDGADGEQRIGRNRQLFFEVAIAVALEQNHLAIPDDGQGQAGHLPVLHGLVDEVVEAVQGGLGWGSGVGSRGLRGRALEIELQRLTLRPGAVDLGTILVDRAIVGPVNGIDDQAELGILERDGGDGDAVGALIDAVQGRCEASILGRGDVQDQVQLGASRGQRSLPIPGNRRLRPAERRESQGGERQQGESSQDCVFHPSPSFRGGLLRRSTHHFGCCHGRASRHLGPRNRSPKERTRARAGKFGRSWFGSEFGTG